MSDFKPSGRPAATSEQINEFESELGIRIPQECRKFYLGPNGGSCFNDGNTITFFALEPATAHSERSSGNYSLRAGVSAFARWLGGETPPLDIDSQRMLNVLPIACDRHGNYVTVVIDDGDNGKIFLYDHDAHEYCYLAESLSEFLKDPVLLKANASHLTKVAFGKLERVRLPVVAAISR